MFQDTPPVIKWEGGVHGRLQLIDQTKLPQKLELLYCTTVEEVWEAIRRLSVRGAPAIGVAAAYGVVLGLREQGKQEGKRLEEEFVNICEYLKTSRPTAVNLFWAIDRQKKVFETHRDKDYSEVLEALLEKAREIENQDRELCRSIGQAGENLIKEGAQVLTHCNAGSLATAGWGTALGVIYQAAEKGRKFQVYATETRPLLQGSRLTTWELTQAGIPTKLIGDSMAGMLMAQKKVDLIITGADRIAANGDTANKIGTYSLAVLAHHHNIPFYIAAPSSTFDLSLQNGEDIPIEYREDAELKKIGDCQTAPEEVEAWNPAFDVTPARLIRGIITEKGVIFPPYEENIPATLKDTLSE